MTERFEKIEILRRGDQAWVRVTDMNAGGKEGDWQPAQPPIPAIIDAIGDSPEHACGLDLKAA